MAETEGADQDAELLRKIIAGDATATRLLVHQKLPRLHSLARRMLDDAVEAEDVVQECFIRLWRQAPTWRSGTARVDTWLHRVTLNLCYDRLRKKREVVVAEVPETADPAPGPGAALDVIEESGRVSSALSQLPLRQREAIVLQYYQGLSNIDAAAVMEVSVEAYESLLSRARRGLRTILGE